jgi:predicted site-specific integrase-resolvase
MCVVLRTMSGTPDTKSDDRINSVIAAEICGVDRATFNRWAQKGLVPIVMVTPGGERIFSRKAVERWIAKRRNRRIGQAS